MLNRPCEGRITSLFAMRLHPIHKKYLMHWGIDIAKTGTVPIIAAASGKVTFAKFTNGYGNTVMIEHLIGGKLYTTVYAHLASIAVRLNQTVNVGQAVGAMGNTGDSKGQHLHFEVHNGEWNNKFTNAVNPLLYMIDPDTKVIQQKLIKAGYKITADGIAGPLTDKAIREFQRSSGLVVDGIAGKATHAVLDKVKTTSPIKRDTKLAKYRLMTGTFATKADAEKAAIRLKKEFGWVVYVKEA
ncbi:peptidoglycan DD-metalloendopeptidase family protein [Sporosarcina sp. FA9]|uniref:peptidoglycan DD-metalloendopeptidase family protein n=1 Tax=Sporosarcina sp. FA9 TaxID=3413030 RepID=UPI003F6587D4